MSEIEKMKRGEDYHASCPNLKKHLNKAKEMCQKYNSIPVSKDNKRNKLIRKLFGKTGEGFVIQPNLYCDYGFNIEIGDNFFANHNCVFLDCAKIKFGKNIFIGPNCGFYTAGHPLDAYERSLWIEYAKPITVGDDVWFGGNVTVMPGVTVGSSVVIGAGSVVTKDIPSNVIAVGNPCKVLRELARSKK